MFTYAHTPRHIMVKVLISGIRFCQPNPSIIKVSKAFHVVLLAATDDRCPSQPILYGFFFPKILFQWGYHSNFCLLTLTFILTFFVCNENFNWWPGILFCRHHIKNEWELGNRKTYMNLTMVWLGCMDARMIKSIICFFRKDIFTNMSSFEKVFFLLGDCIRKSLERKAVHMRDYIKFHESKLVSFGWKAVEVVVI